MFVEHLEEEVVILFDDCLATQFIGYNIALKIKKLL